jgi:hypothetical protein
LYNNACSSARLLSTPGNETIDIVELVIPPDPHRALDFGMDIFQSEMAEELGDTVDIEFVVIVVWSIDRALLGRLGVSAEPQTVSWSRTDNAPCALGSNL